MLIVNLYPGRADGGDRLHFLYPDDPAVTVRVTGVVRDESAAFEVTGPHGVTRTGAAEGYAPAPLPGLPLCRVKLLDTRCGRAKLGIVSPAGVTVYRGDVLRAKAGAAAGA